MDKIMNNNNGYLGDLIETAIDVIQYQVELRTDGNIARDDIDGLLDEYADQITGNDNGATPNRIYTGDAKEFYDANADTEELLEWLKDVDSVGLMAKYYAEDNYNALDVLEAIRVYEANREAIVDAVYNYYK